MLYTVGHTLNYLRAIARSEDGFIVKTGRTQDYSGGIVFKTYADAEAYLQDIHHADDWSVWGIDVPFHHKHIGKSEDGYYALLHDTPLLIVDKRLIQQCITAEERLSWECDT
jgi:hypothetical protein